MPPKKIAIIDPKIQRFLQELKACIILRRGVDLEDVVFMDMEVRDLFDIICRNNIILSATLPELDKWNETQKQEKDKR